jgi:hypothetical protein
MTAIANAPDLATTDYLVVGLATCYIRDDGEVKEVTVLEPVPSAYLEALFHGIPTAYKCLYGTTLGAVVGDGSATMPADAPADAQFCADFVARAAATARTYKARTVATTLVPLGTRHTPENYSTEKKRVLNLDPVVTAEDNVKQHEYTHKVL